MDKHSVLMKDEDQVLIQPYTTARVRDAASIS